MDDQLGPRATECAGDSLTEQAPAWPSAPPSSHALPSSQPSPTGGLEGSGSPSPAQTFSQRCLEGFSLGNFDKKLSTLSAQSTFKSPRGNLLQSSSYI